VEAAVGKERRPRGLVLVNAMHITASVFINDDEPGLHQTCGVARAARAVRRLTGTLRAQPHRRE
jgi:thiamine phosphate synthase YjbQ (UPF0047 family)